MAFENGLLVSLPASELPKIAPTASLFGLPALFEAGLSEPLRAAIATLEALKTRLLFVARPEMFTGGATLEWLATRCEGIVDHLHISDGSAVKLLPGFRNHVFFHGLGRRDDYDALTRLENRLPEIFSQLQSQINTALSFRWKDKFVQPPTSVMTGVGGADASGFELRRLFLSRHSSEDSAGRTLSFAPLDPRASPFGEVHYIRLTERALRDPDYTRELASLMTRLFADRRQCAIFVAPRLGDATASPHVRLRALAAGLIDGGANLPHATVPNILSATDDLPAEALESMFGVRRLIVDDADDFWRSPASFYETFESVTVYAHRRRHDPIAFQRLLSDVYGPRTLIAWSSARERPRL
jgi:hypothetical protein